MTGPLRLGSQSNHPAEFREVEALNRNDAHSTARGARFTHAMAGDKRINQGKPLMIDRLDPHVLTTIDLAACKDGYLRVLGMRLETFGAGRVAFVFGAQKINVRVHGHEHAVPARWTFVLSLRWRLKR